MSDKTYVNVVSSTITGLIAGYVANKINLDYLPIILTGGIAMSLGEVFPIFSKEKISKQEKVKQGLLAAITGITVITMTQMPKISEDYSKLFSKQTNQSASQQYQNDNINVLGEYHPTNLETKVEAKN